MNELAVIVCTHNPDPARLARALAGLRAQSLAATRWSLWVVDNGSAPAIAPEAVCWHPLGTVVREAELGLTPARLRGIRESHGDLLVFVDDDNILAPDYLEHALRIAAQYPHLGAWSGQSRPEFAEPPPAWTRRYWGILALRDVAVAKWSNLPCEPETQPLGCGLCVRRAVAERYVAMHERGERVFLFDRRGDSLMSAGDQDLAATACELGLGQGVFPELTLTHLIPPARLTPAYLARLAHGVHYSGTVLRALRAPDRLQDRTPLRCRLADALRALRLRQPHRAIFRAAMRGEREACAWLACMRLDKK